MDRWPVCTCVNSEWWLWPSASPNVQSRFPRTFQESFDPLDYYNRPRNARKMTLTSPESRRQLGQISWTTETRTVKISTNPWWGPRLNSLEISFSQTILTKSSEPKDYSRVKPQIIWIGRENCGMSQGPQNVKLSYSLHEVTGFRPHTN